MVVIIVRDLNGQVLFREDVSLPLPHWCRSLTKAGLQ